VLVLNDCGIDRAGKAEELQKKCYSVKELDLAQNNLENWNEVRRSTKKKKRETLKRFDTHETFHS
jgi:hypothetical protein